MNNDIVYDIFHYPFTHRFLTVTNIFPVTLSYIHKYIYIIEKRYAKYTNIIKFLQFQHTHTYF